MRRGIIPARKVQTGKMIEGVADRLSIEFELILRVRTTAQSLQASSSCIGIAVGG
jgi:hypothetical protein